VFGVEMTAVECRLCLALQCQLEQCSMSLDWQGYWANGNEDEGWVDWHWMC